MNHVFIPSDDETRPVSEHSVCPETSAELESALRTIACASDIETLVTALIEYAYVCECNRIDRYSRQHAQTRILSHPLLVSMQQAVARKVQPRTNRMTYRDIQIIFPSTLPDIWLERAAACTEETRRHLSVVHELIIRSSPEEKEELIRERPEGIVVADRLFPDTDVFPDYVQQFRARLKSLPDYLRTHIQFILAYTGKLTYVFDRGAKRGVFREVNHQKIAALIADRMAERAARTSDVILGS